MRFTCNKLRQIFLDYFKEKGHEVVPSGSLVPTDDPTLLFTNAGMVPFKNIFLGIQKVPYNTATSSQRCVRAGGKHNDLEQVGYSKRHHTFLEMLGNFSFGAYFKEEAILYAWTFLTDVLHIPKERLWVSVFKDDPEAERIWLQEIGIDPAHLSHCGEEDNFWSMGDIGPCGPCSEIFYDHGAEFDGGPPGSADQDGDRYVEIWNLVFMQYNRDLNGKLTPLPKPCIDTGMGLERLAAVMQGVHDNYHIDVFVYLLKAVGRVLGSEQFDETALRVIADHIRSTAFLIIDGIVPGNEGRGYVLRRIIRRAVRYGYNLGEKKPFFYRLVQALVDCMGEAYSELARQQSFIEQVIKTEEEQFSNTLKKGLKLFHEEIIKVASGSMLPGETVFLLYDTYGFPPDLTADMAKEQGVNIDNDGFVAAMKKQKQLSSQSQRFKIDTSKQLSVASVTEFTGYEQLADEARVQQLFVDGVEVGSINASVDAVIVLDRTPFYAESGGQVGDRGMITSANGNGAFQVHTTQKQGNTFVHFGTQLEGSLSCHETVQAEVDSRRHDTVLNHSATHLLHQALRDVLGTHVMQKGSLVDPERLRFDFSHPKALTDDELLTVEDLVNYQIRSNLATDIDVTDLESAKRSGVLALFNEKYANDVRVVRMGEFSAELCGGTHVARTGDIGLFIITSESACASGIRRIEAITGEAALKRVQSRDKKVKELSKILKVKEDRLSERLTQVLLEQKAQAKAINQLKQQHMHSGKSELIKQAELIGGIHVLAAQLPAMDDAHLKQMLDQLKEQLDPAAVIVATAQDNKIKLVAGVTKSASDRISASDLLKHVAAKVGGRGGGRAEFAQGGGDQLDQLEQALTSVKGWVKQQLG